MAFEVSTLKVVGDTSELKPVIPVLREIKGESAKTEKATKGVADGFDKAGDSAAKAKGKIKGTSSAMTAAQKSAKAAAKAIGVLALSYASFQTAAVAVRQAREFNAALAETSTLIEGTPAQMEALSGSARDLASAFGGTATAQVQAFYQAISAGAGSIEDASILLESANKLAIGGVTGVETAVDALTTAMNAYAASGLTAADASDALFVGIKAGKTTAAELSAALGNIVPIASSVGVSFDEVVAATAALTTQGQSTSVAVTGLRGVLAGILKPTSEAVKLSDRLGLSFNTQALQAQGLSGFLDSVITATGGSQEQMAQLFGSVEALNAVLAFAGGAGDAFADTLGDMGSKAGATDEAYEKMASSLDQRWSRAVAAGSDVLLGLGNILLTVVVPVLETAAGFAVGLSNAFEALVSPIGNVFGALGQSGQAEDGQLALQAAIDNTSIAIGDQVNASNFLKVALSDGNIITLEAATVQLELAKARREDIRALEEQRIAQALQGEAYQQILADLQTARDAFRSVRLVDTEQLEDAEQHIADMIARQQEFIEDVKKGSVLREEESDLLRQIEANIAELERQQRILSGETEYTVELTDRLGASVANISYGKAIAGAQALAEKMNISLHAAMQMMGLLGAAQQAANDVVVFDPRDSRYDKAQADQAAHLERIKKTMAEIQSETAKAAKGFKAAGSAGSSAGKRASGGMSEAQKATEAATKEAERLAEQYERGFTGPIESAVDSTLDYMLNGFKGGFKGLWDIAKSTLIDIAKFYLGNPIKLALGIGGIGLPGAAGAGVQNILTGGAGGGGLLSGLASNLLGGLGGWIEGVTTGIQGILTGGGLGSSFANLGGLLSGSVSGAGAIGAALPAVGVVIAAISFFKKKTTLLDTGLKLTADAIESIVEEFDEIETKRFWGLSKKVSKNYRAAESDTADPILEAIEQIRESALGLGEILGLTADNFASFKAEVEFSTKGISQEEAEERLGYALNDIADALAGAALGWFDVNLVEGVRREGDSWMSALQNLAAAITVTNYSLDELGFAMFDASVAGAKAARDFADAFGGLDGFANGISAYVDAFYSDGEKLEIITKRVREALDGIDPNNINTAIESRGDFKSLTDWAGSNAANDPGQANLFAKLINVTPLIDQMFQLQDAVNGTTVSAVAGQEELDSWNNQITTLTAQLNKLTMPTEEFRQWERELLPALAREAYDAAKALEDQIDAENAAATLRAKNASDQERLNTSLIAAQEAFAAVGGEVDILVSSREVELAGLSDVNAETLKLVYNLQDQTAALVELNAKFSAFVGEFYSDTDQMDQAGAKITAALEGVFSQEQISAALESRDAFRDLFEAAGGSIGNMGGDASKAVISVTDLATSFFTLKESLAAVAEETDPVSQALTAQQIQYGDLQDQLASAQAELNSLTLTAAELREIEKNAIADANLEIWGMVKATEALIDANREAQRLATIEDGLLRRLYTANGDTDALRALERADFGNLTDELEVLLDQVWAAEDAAASAGEAIDDVSIAIDDFSDALQSAELALIRARDGEDAYREAYLATLEDFQVENQKLIWGYEDQIDAIEATAAAEADLESQRTSLIDTLSGLQLEYTRLTEGEAAARAVILSQMPEQLRAYQQQIDAAQDLIDAENARIARLDKAATEEADLTNQLYELTGNQAAIRALVLDGLEEENHALQIRVWALQDAAAAETDAAEQIAASSTAMQDALSLVERLINDAISGIRETADRQISALQARLLSAETAFDAISGRFENAYDVVRASIDADRTLAVIQYEGAIARLDGRIRDAAGSVDTLGTIFGLLDNALDSRAIKSRSIEAQNYATAQAFLLSQDGGITTDQGKLEQALEAVNGDTSQFFDDAGSFRHEYLKTSIAISKMRDNAEEQLTDAERTVSILEAQKASREVQHERELERLDLQLEQAEKIYETAIGNIVAIMDVDTSIEDLTKVAKEFTAENIALQELTDFTNKKIAEIEEDANKQIEILSSQLLTQRALVDAALGNIAASETIAEAIEDLAREIVIYNEGSGGTPAFATGGQHRGGFARVAENDVELVSPSRIFSGGETRAMLDNSVIVEQLRTLRRENSEMHSELKQLQKRTMLSSDQTALLTKANYDDRKTAEETA